MGFHSLRLVGGGLQDSKAARKTGYGSHDLLDRAVNYPDLKSALADLDLSVGTTSKARIKRYDAHTPSQISDILEGKRQIVNKVGLVFGSEENGLSTQELDQCDLISTIPMAVAYPSLNLSQSTLIYAWELAKSAPSIKEKTTSPRFQSLLKEEMNHLLQQLGFDQKPLVQQRILDRVFTMNTDDSELLMTVLNKLNRDE